MHNFQRPQAPTGHMNEDVNNRYGPGPPLSEQSAPPNRPLTYGPSTDFRLIGSRWVSFPDGVANVPV